MNRNCDIIKDLLPLYADDVCTEESRKLVAEHLAECSECRKMLEKMGKGVTVEADADVNIMKRIKKRMRIEKMIVGLISLALVLALGLASLLLLGNTYCDMDLQKLSIGNDVKAEVDENGDLWLILNNYASTEDYLLPTVSDTNGRHLGVDKDFDASSKAGVGVTLMHRRIDSFSNTELSNDKEHMIKYINVDEKSIDRFFYYDQKSNTEYTLWERGNND